MGIRQEKKSFRRWRGIAVLFIVACVLLAALCGVLYVKLNAVQGELEERVTRAEAELEALRRENEVLRAGSRAETGREIVSASPDDSVTPASGTAAANAPAVPTPAENGAGEKSSAAENATQKPNDRAESITAPEPVPAPANTVLLDDLDVGSVVNIELLGGELDDYFAAYVITEGDPVYTRIIGQSYVENDYVALSDLRYLKLLHYNFDHKPQVGELIVNKTIADDVLSIFKELFDIEYEIEKMYLVDNYWTGDGETSDTASIDDNNTSAFCYRAATGSGRLSYHALGLAIDLNPQQNPYVTYTDGVPHWVHENAGDYIDRTSGDPHVIVSGDVCCSLFARYGFTWGGDWSNPKDYQHFEKRS